MIDVGADESSLLLNVGIILGVAGPRLICIMVIVAPFGKVICELQSGCVGRGILKVNDYQLLVGILR